MSALPWKSREERFWAKVDKSGDCWLWTGYRDRHGYGQFKTDSGVAYSHRFSYVLRFGKVPEDLVLDHLCRMPSCVNPDHLEPVTQRINVLRGESPSAKQARSNRCQMGHPLAGENLIVDARGKRRCRQCKREWARAYRAARRADRLACEQMEREEGWAS